MPKKQLFYFALIILASISIWLFLSDKKSTITDDNNFSVSDTASVNKYLLPTEAALQLPWKEKKIIGL